MRWLDGHACRTCQTFPGHLRVQARRETSQLAVHWLDETAAAAPGPCATTVRTLFDDWHPSPTYRTTDVRFSRKKNAITFARFSVRRERRGRGINFQPSCNNVVHQMLGASPRATVTSFTIPTNMIIPYPSRSLYAPCTRALRMLMLPGCGGQVDFGNGHHQCAVSCLTRGQIFPICVQFRGIWRVCVYSAHVLASSVFA